MGHFSAEQMSTVHVEQLYFQGWIINRSSFVTSFRSLWGDQSHSLPSTVVAPRQQILVKSFYSAGEASFYRDTLLFILSSQVLLSVFSWVKGQSKETWFQERQESARSSLSSAVLCVHNCQAATPVHPERGWLGQCIQPKWMDQNY